MLTRAPRPPDAPLRIMDVGTGCGTIAISLAVALRRRRMLDDVRILATDASADALQLARENAVGHAVADRVRFLEADLLPPVMDPPFDVVLANLPYIPAALIPGLPIAASFEPRSALDGGADGLDEIRRLLDRLDDALAPGGVALLEIGSDQGAGVAGALAERHPGWAVRIERDLGGAARVARIDRPGAWQDGR
jgi:release factor glutamine methyltransferase